jgi:hypothetical protein
MLEITDVRRRRKLPGSAETELRLRRNARGSSFVRRNMFLIGVLL